MKRKSFLQQMAMGAGALLTIPPILNAQATAPKNLLKDEPLPFEMVKDFVVAGHKDLDKIKAMLKENPNLLYAAWDWGNGDFETALEGAGHMGLKDIANFLIEQGARPNIFVLTMLGKTKEVKTLLRSYPELLNSKGPHGFTLLHHAQKGGDDAKKLLKYLQEKGLTETNIKLKN
jgi:ankyrin repeat protein